MNPTQAEFQPGAYKAMQGEKRERWMELAEQAAVEQDPVKMLALVQELNRLLLEKEQKSLRNEATTSSGHDASGHDDSGHNTSGQ